MVGKTRRRGAKFLVVLEDWESLLIVEKVDKELKKWLRDYESGCPQIS